MSININQGSSSIWRKTEIHKGRCSITFWPKQGTTWEEMNAWLEKQYGKYDRHWDWRGFGEDVNDEEFCVALVKKACTFYCGCKYDDDDEDQDSDDDEE